MTEHKPFEGDLTVGSIYTDIYLNVSREITRIHNGLVYYELLAESGQRTPNLIAEEFFRELTGGEKPTPKLNELSKTNHLPRRVQDAINNTIHTMTINAAQRPVAFGYEVARAAIEAYESPLPKLVEALKRIALISNQDFGGDWDEIEEAREIAKDALALVESEVEG